MKGGEIKKVVSIYFGMGCRLTKDKVKKEVYDV